MNSKTRREVRAFVDLNVLLIGAVNLALQEETAEVKIIRNLLEGGVKLVTSLKQLEELTFASKFSTNRSSIDIWFACILNIFAPILP